MNSMSKKLAITVTASAIALTLITIILWEYGYISDLKQTILNKDKQLAAAEQNLLEKDAIITDLDAQLQLYRDTVLRLQLENQQLKAKIETLKGTVSKLSLTIQKHDDKVRELTAEIHRLSASSKSDKGQIAALEAKRDELLKEIEKRDHERMALLERQRTQEAEQKSNDKQIEKLNAQVEAALDKADPTPLVPSPEVLDEPTINQAPGELPKANNSPEISTEMQAAIVNRQAERLMNVVSKTTVQFNSISLRNREGSSEVKKIKERDNDWRYTYLDFDLNNIDKEAIMDEYFILQIFDLDNNNVLPYNEKNPAFPESETGAGGFKFKYDGKPISVRYINTQEKEGINFELRLFYVNKKGLTFPLANGTRRLITEGKVAVN